MGALAAPLVQAGLATYAPWSRSLAMLSPQPDRPATDAVWLFEFACDRVSKADEADLLDRIRRRAARSPVSRTPSS